MKKRKIISLGILLFIIFYFSVFLRPPLPKGWSNVKVGMKRSDILLSFPKIKDDLRGDDYDTLSVENTMPYYRKGFWQMLIFYYQNDIASTVTYRYVDEGCDIFNKTITENLRKRHN